MENEKVHVGTISSIPTNEQEIYARHWKTTDFLTKLKNTHDEIDAIDLIMAETPDGSMALSTYLNYTLQGGNFQFFNARTGKLIKKYDKEFTQFCARIGKSTGCGLDGLNKELATSSYLHGGMAIEIVVKEDLSDIEEVLVVDPKTFVKYSYNSNTKEWNIYQSNNKGKLINLCDGNFFHIPFQPKIGTPVGTLKFKPAIMATTMYWQFMADIGVVLRRIAIPRYVLSIDTQAVVESGTPLQKSDLSEQTKLIESAFEMARASLRNIGKDSDIITSQTNKLDVIGGGVNGTGIDVRAWIEILIPELCNSYQLPLVLMNRQEGGSYALGTAEMKSFTDTIDGQRLSLKRMNEHIGNQWARLKGYNVICKYTPKPLDWQKQEEKWKARLLELEHIRRKEEYGYIDKVQAAQESGGSETPNYNSKAFYEYLTKYLSETATTANDESSTNEKAVTTDEKEKD